MSKEAMKLALEALEHCKDVIVERGLNGSPEFAKKWGLTLPLERSEKAITALREALAKQPAQQEPVAWMTKTGSVWKTKADETDEPLYTSSQPAQPSKPLTKDQIAKFYGGDSPIVLQIIRDTEAAHGITGEQA